MVDCTTDIAVSAPFDEGGKVFIYYGSKETGINSTVQQASVWWEWSGVDSVLIVHTDNHSWADDQSGDQLDQQWWHYWVWFQSGWEVDVDDNQYRGDTTLSEVIEQLFELHTHRFVVSAIGTSSTNGQAVFVLR